MINPNNNTTLREIPKCEEVKKIIFNLRRDNLMGQDGLSSRFYIGC